MSDPHTKFEVNRSKRSQVIAQKSCRTGTLQNDERFVILDVMNNALTDSLQIWCVDYSWTVEGSFRKLAPGGAACCHQVAPSENGFRAIT